MFIVAPAASSAKLRRSGMNGTGDIVRASNTCRSYGAWPGMVGTTTINMALLAELGQPSVRKDPCEVLSELDALQTLRVAAMPISPRSCGFTA
jgi:hypothetical protein